MNSDITVLDFFAGSGTTAQAVHNLNLEDGGKRKCILIQIDEKTYEDNGGCETAKKGCEKAFAAGFRSISEITRVRISKFENQF